MITKFDSIKIEIKDFKNETCKRFDLIETKIRYIKVDINTLKQLPTISSELKNL